MKVATTPQTQSHRTRLLRPGQSLVHANPVPTTVSSFIQKKPSGSAPHGFRPGNHPIAAPPVYRPNAANSLQQKPATTAPPVYRPPIAKMTAPPVYRPQMAVQRVTVVPLRSSQPRNPNSEQPKVASPPVYRPHVSLQRSVKPGPIAPVSSVVSLTQTTTAAPPVYRPQMALQPRLRDVKCRVFTGAITAGKSILQPRPANLSRTIQRGHDKKATAITPMDMQNASFSTVTALLWIDPNGDNDWECHGKFTSDKQGHAEEHLLTYLSTDVYYSGSAKVVIELTASPCGSDSANCSKQLIDFQKSEAADRGIESVKVKALGFYKGSEDSMYNATAMISEGVDFEIWDVQNEMTEGTSEGYDNFDSMQNFAMAEVYQLPKSGRKTSAFDKSKFNQDKFEKYMDS